MTQAKQDRLKRERYRIEYKAPKHHIEVATNSLHREGCAILAVTHDIEAALDEAEHILCLCQRHPAPGTHAAPFYGTADAYRAFLEHGCDCHGTHDAL